jgi:hypothetical protein
MTKAQNPKQYHSEDRRLAFARKTLLRKREQGFEHLIFDI